jgi:hypothetical protein
VRESLQHAFGPVPVLAAGRMNDPNEEHPQHVDEHMAFAPGYFLAGIIASRLSPLLGGLHALRVQNCRWRLGLASGLPPHQGAQAVIDPLPDALQAPPAEIPVHGRPRRVLPRQIAPRETRAIEIEDGVKHEPHLRRPWPPSWSGRRKQRFDTIPLSVGDVAGVELVAHAPMLPQPIETFQNTLLQERSLLF